MDSMDQGSRKDHCVDSFGDVLFVNVGIICCSRKRNGVGEINWLQCGFLHGQLDDSIFFFVG